MKRLFFVFALGATLTSALPTDQSPLVHDLQATRKGNKVLLTWTQPHTSTTVAKVCRNIASSSTTPSHTCTQPIGEVPQKTSKTTAQFTDTLSEDATASNPLQFAIYTVEIHDGRGRSAGFSNPVSVPLAPTLPAK